MNMAGQATKTNAADEPSLGNGRSTFTEETRTAATAKQKRKKGGFPLMVPKDRVVVLDSSRL